MALIWTLTTIEYLTATDRKNKDIHANRKNKDILYHVGVIAYQLLKIMILTLTLYTLKRTRFSGGDIIFGAIMLFILWLSGVSS